MIHIIVPINSPVRTFDLSVQEQIEQAGVFPHAHLNVVAARVLEGVCPRSEVLGMV